MKKVFEDGSYLHILTIGDKVRITICGKDSDREDRAMLLTAELDKVEFDSLISKPE